MRLRIALVVLSIPVTALAQETPPRDVIPLLEQYDFERRLDHFDLPDRLAEISGLAFTSDGRLFGHDDERGRVHHIDTSAGDVGARFSLGARTVRDDFEGLAIVGERFFLISSAARIYEFREVEDRGSSQFVVSDTNLGRRCEVEGFDFDPSEDELLIACKEARPDDGFIVVYRWPIDPLLEMPSPIRIDKDELAAFDLDDDFDPSAVTVTPSGTILLLAGRQESLIEIDRAGRILAGVELSANRHPQPEGLAFGPDGTLFIADERNGRAARITAYGRPGSGGDR